MTSSPATPAIEPFETQLRSLCHTPSGPYLRPFAPAPHWRSARVFIVGTNPATPLREEFASFDDYWHALTQDSAAFERAYLAQRGGKPSKTARRASHFTEAVGEQHILRTNACAYPTRSWKELKGAAKGDQLAHGRAILAALTDLCRPVAILFHGREAIQASSSLFGVALDPYQPLGEQQYAVSPWGGAPPMRLYAYPHLSGVGVRKGFKVSAMDEELKRLGQRVALELQQA